MLHPLFRDLFTSMGLPNATFPAAPQTFRTRHGRRRVYLSRSDALAYDAGFELYPAALADSTHTPHRDGWLDAQEEAFEQISAAPRQLHWD